MLPLLATKYVARRGAGGPTCVQLSSPDELSCSAGEAEGVKERERLRRDAVDGAGEDANDGIDEAADHRNAHESTSLSGSAEL